MMNRITKFGMPVLLAVATIAVLAVLSIATNAQVASAQTGDTPKTPDIGVTGTGHVLVQPDIAIANVGVDITAATLADATKQASDKMTAVLTAIKGQGVDAQDIQTVSYNVYPITNQPKEGETPKITGYHVNNIVSVKVRTMANVGKVLDAALGAGANSINSVTFTVNDPSKAQDQARTQAVQNAMAKAKTLASAAGVQVGKIMSISEVSSPVMFRSGAFDTAPAASGAGPVEAGQTEITVTVEMHFQISQ
jgi:uncharacterized protein YggE